MFSSKEKQAIRQAIQEITHNAHVSKKTTALALRGMFGRRDSKKADIEEIFRALDKNQDPIIHDDSTSGWMHLAVSQFGVTVGDIRKMDFGQKMKVVLMDRNVGDYTNGIKKTLFNPAKVGFSYATYIHGENLTGMLLFDDGVCHVPFVWEINVGVFDPLSYWGGLAEGLTHADLDDNILVGWRGPAINAKDLSLLPRSIRLYGTWWDDYGVSKYNDWLHKK